MLTPRRQALGELGENFKALEQGSKDMVSQVVHLDNSAFSTLNSSATGEKISYRKYCQILVPLLMVWDSVWQAVSD